jgi:hypothetical protein
MWFHGRRRALFWGIFRGVFRSFGAPRFRTRGFRAGSFDRDRLGLCHRLGARDFLFVSRRRMLDCRSEILRLSRVGAFAGAAFGSDTPAHFERNIVVERTGMRFLVSYAEFRQEIEDHVWLDLELASQLVDADFTHTMMPPGCKKILLLGI